MTSSQRLRWPAPRATVVLAVVVAVTVLTFWAAAAARTRGSATGDGGVKLWQVQGILHSGQLDAPIDYAGAKYDPDHKYSPFVSPWFFWQDGKPYSEYTSPFIWASVPLYALFNHAGLLIIPWLSGVLLVILSAWLAWRVRPDRWAALAPLVVGLSSPVLVYSLEFWEHTPGAMLAGLAIAAMVKALDSRRAPIWLIVAGAAIGLGLTMRAELYVFPIAIIVGWVVIRRAARDGVTIGAYSLRAMTKRVGVPLIWVAVGGLLIAGPWWLFQLIRWGSPFGPRLQQNVPLLGGGEMLARLGDTTGHNYVMLWPHDGSAVDVIAGLLIVAVGLAVSVRVVGKIQKSGVKIQSAGFWLLAATLVVIEVLTTWRVSQGQRPNDLLTTFPLVLLLLLPINQSKIQNPKSEILRFLFVTSFTFALLVLLVSPFEGGIQWGPRFLLPLVAPLSVVIVIRVARLLENSSQRGRIAIGGVAAIGLLAGAYSTWFGVQFMRQGQIASEFMSAVIGQSSERVVVADTWFLTQNAPYTMGDKIWLLAESDKQMFNLLQMLRKTTSEPAMIYVSALTWAHIDPAPMMGPRIQETGERTYINSPTQYIELSRYLLLK